MFKRRIFLTIVALSSLYVGSYLVLSRRGPAQAQEWNAKGFYFFEPRDSDLWRFSNYGCVCLYSPLIIADTWLGTGRWPACEPMWGLSK